MSFYRLSFLLVISHILMASLHTSYVFGCQTLWVQTSFQSRVNYFTTKIILCWESYLMPHVLKVISTPGGGNFIPSPTLISGNHSDECFPALFLDSGSFQSHMCKRVLSKRLRGLFVGFCSHLSGKLPPLQYTSLQTLATLASPDANSAILFNSARPHLFLSLICSLGTAASHEAGLLWAHLTHYTFCQGSHISACHRSQNHCFIYILQFLAVQGRGVNLALATSPQQKAKVFTLKTQLPC